MKLIYSRINKKGDIYRRRTKISTKDFFTFAELCKLPTCHIKLYNFLQLHEHQYKNGQTYEAALANQTVSLKYTELQEFFSNKNQFTKAKEFFVEKKCIVRSLESRSNYIINPNFISFLSFSQSDFSKEILELFA